MSDYTCMACEESAENLLILYCGEHAYCFECLQVAVQVAIDDEKHYPLPCGSALCGSIPDHLVEDCLSNGNAETQTLLETFKTKAQEYQVPASSRTYCANGECISALGHSRFIPYAASGSDNRVICPDCDAITCCHCKVMLHDPVGHACKGVQQDQGIKTYIASLPEDDRWLWRKCFSCGIWVEKESVCNHMTCNCGAEFCLVCGRHWESMLSCRWGCPKSEAPVYDDEGYNQYGFNPETGLDREGNPWDPSDSHEDWGSQGDDGNNGSDDEERVVGEDGFDQWGRDDEGYGRDGFREDGWDREGYDREGFDSWGWNREGYDQQ